MFEFVWNEEGHMIRDTILCLGALALLASMPYLCSLGGDHSKFDHSQRLRSATGPGGYLDSEYNQRANMRATGTQDVQLDQDVRDRYLRERGQ